MAERGDWSCTCSNCSQIKILNDTMTVYEQLYHWRQLNTLFMRFYYVYYLIIKVGNIQYWVTKISLKIKIKIKKNQDQRFYSEFVLVS